MKIQTVTINKYKAFTKSEVIPIGGQNVFVYGENGSGKSSFYYALKDFFQSSVEEIRMEDLRNYTLNDGNTDCSIEVEFDGQVKNIINEGTKNTEIATIRNANRLKSFLTYKHLLSVHNVKVDDEINVFELIVNGVMKHFSSEIVTGGVELGQLWTELAAANEKEYGRGTEFYFARQKKASVERKALAFNNAVNRLFLPGDDYLAPAVNKILEHLIPNFKIEFSRRTITVDQWGRISDPAILLRIEDNGVVLDTHHPHFSLNEAKLSAIAISIFLGAILRQSPFSKDIKPLFLDDILIGLDNENRLKILNLLLQEDLLEDENNKVFGDFQIFITTYDRHWYEVAKQNLTGWKFIEFYKGDEGPEVIHEVKSNYERADSYFKARDFPACANYLRKECERILKDKLLETYRVEDGLKALVKPIKLDTLIDRLKVYYEDLGLQPPLDLVRNLQNYKSVLLNPMSHDDVESPIYKNDLELMFQTLSELETLVLPQRTVLLNKGQLLTLALPAITYTAELEIAKPVYVAEDNGVKTTSPITFFFKTWTREGVDFAKDIGSPPEAYTDLERLGKIKTSLIPIEKAVLGLNRTFDDRGVAQITETDLLNSITNQADTLTTIIQTATV